MLQFPFPSFFEQFSFVLGLAEIELIVFTASHAVSCFRFVAKTVLISHQCFDCCLHRVKAFFFYNSAHTASGLWVGGSPGWEKAGTRNVNWPKG